MCAKQTSSFPFHIKQQWLQAVLPTSITLASLINLCEAIKQYTLTEVFLFQVYDHLLKQCVDGKIFCSCVMHLHVFRKLAVCLQD